MAKSKPNFRLSGIPAEYQSKKDVHLLVQRILAIDVSPGELHIKSLAPSPYRPEYNVATFYFENTPPQLLDETKTWWRFPAGDDADSEALTLDTHFHGFTPLQQAINGDFSMDVVAISGLNGHAFGSFKDRGSSFMWLRDALPKDLPSARILIYGYDTKLLESESTQNMIDIGRKLERQLRLIRKPKQDRPIIFIGHSVGGLVIKQAVIEHLEGGHTDTSMLNFISAFLFFGVPHIGMNIKPFRPMVKENPNRSFLESLDKTSAFLQCQNRPFKTALEVRSPEVIAFYETERSQTPEEVNNIWFLTGPYEVSVEEHSATWHSTQKYPITRSHSESVKFQSNHDQDYLYVLDILRQLASKQRPVVGLLEARRPAPIQLSEDHKACLQSLAFSEQESGYHKVHSAQDTCQWLFENEQFKQWMTEPGSLFWIRGVPGAGKSVLMKSATRMMQCSQSRSAVVHFFCQGIGTPLQKTPVGVFRALLNSLLQFFPDHLDRLKATFQERQTRFGPNKWEWDEDELRQVMFDALTSSTKSQPIIIFVDALDECGETPARQLIEFFRRIEDAAQDEGASVKICFSSRSYPNLGLSEIPGISVEEYNRKDIRTVVRRSLLEITPIKIRQEIESKILSKARGVFQWAVLVANGVAQKDRDGVRDDELFKIVDNIPEGLDQLYTTIINGVRPVEKYQAFKLLRWILSSMRPLAARELRDALATDADMDRTSISELQRHPSWIEDFGKFERHIQTLSRGLVQLQTRKQGREYGLNDDSKPSDEDTPRDEDEFDNRGEFDNDGDSDSGGESDSEGEYYSESESDDCWKREAQFIHQSVADYLQNKPAQLSMHCPHPPHVQTSQSDIAHFELSRSCIKYIKLEATGESADNSSSRSSPEPGLAQYAAQSFLYHIQQVEQRGICQCDLASLFQGEFLYNLESLWEIYKDDGLPDFDLRARDFWGSLLDKGTPLRTLLATGSKTAVSQYIQSNDALLGDCDTEGNTPLHLAIIWRHQEIALLILSASTPATVPNPQVISTTQAAAADGQKQGTESQLGRYDWMHFTNMHGQTPLACAAQIGDDKVVQQLLQLGKASVDVRDNYGRTPLSWAAANLHVPIIELLLEVDGINLENKDQRGDTPLNLAVKPTEGFLPRLPSRDSRVYSDLQQARLKFLHVEENLRYLEQLQSTFSPAQEAFLIERVTAIEQDMQAIQSLMPQIQAKIQELSQEHPIQVTELQQLQQDDIHLILSNEQQMILFRHELCSQLQLSMDKKRLSKETMKSISVQQCQVVKLLVDKGANVEAMDDDGHTPLWWADRLGEERLTELLQNAPGCSRHRGSYSPPDVAVANQNTPKRSAEEPAEGDGERFRGRHI